MSTIEFFVDLPPRGHAGNGSHGHWSGKAKQRAEYRQDVGWRAVEAIGDGERCGLLSEGRKLTRKRVSLVFGNKGGRAVKLYQPRDVPNAVAAAKGLFDGLKDAGLIVDDSAKFMELGDVTIDSKAGPWVKVTVESVEASDG